MPAEGSATAKNGEKKIMPGMKKERKKRKAEVGHENENLYSGLNADMTIE